MRLKLLAAAAMGAAIIAPACALAATTVTNPVASGPLSGPNIFTFGNVLAKGASANTYVYTFQTTGSWDALLAMQAQNFSTKTPTVEPVQFELDKLEGTKWVQIDSSSKSDGAVIPTLGSLELMAGSYELVTDYIGVPKTATGSLDGSITLTAVPEPATWAFLMLGIGAIGAAMRSRRKAGLAVAAG